MWLHLDSAVTVLTLVTISYLSNSTSTVVHESNNSSSQNSDEVEGRIIGGKPVNIFLYPFLVQFFNQGALCAGSIISSWTVLTAAHCFDFNRDIFDMLIQVGTTFTYDYDAVTYDLIVYLLHPEYNKTVQFDSDVALIFVERPIEFSKNVQKAILVDTGSWMRSDQNNFVATGWGWTNYGGPISERGLMTTYLRYVSRQRCSDLHQLDMTPNMFCLYGEGVRDTCRGDSGGGILWKGMIVGIVSHGDGCARKGKPSVYTNVWYFRNWIEENVRNFFHNYCKLIKNND